MLFFARVENVTNGQTHIGRWVKNVTKGQMHIGGWVKSVTNGQTHIGGCVENGRTHRGKKGDTH